MEQTLALELWVASLAVAGAIGWIIGERGSAMRLGELVRDADVEAEREGLFTLSFQSSSERPSANAAVEAKQSDEDRRISETRHPTPASASESMPRAQIFSAMPPIDELQEEVRSIRQSTASWFAPIECHEGPSERRAATPREVLSNYRSAIEALTEASDHIDARPAEANEPVDAEAFFAGLERHLEMYREAPDGRDESRQRTITVDPHPSWANDPLG